MYNVLPAVMVYEYIHIKYNIILLYFFYRAINFFSKRSQLLQICKCFPVKFFTTYHN